MKRLLATVLLSLSLASGAWAQGTLNTPQHSSGYKPDFEPPAASACPADTRVWVNTSSHIYHLPGERYYGRTKNGEYMCKKAADAAGYRMTRNGQ